MQQNSKTTIINDKSFDIIIAINGDINNAATMLYNNICKIIINENLFDPFYSAEIEYIDNLHALEAGSNNSTVDGAGYRYRGDGYDRVTLKISPHDDTIPNEYKSTINFTCDLCVVDTYRKYNSELNQFTKTLILEDYHKHILSERQSYFTTTNKISYPAYRSNNDRRMFTGNAIRNIISKHLGKQYINFDAWDDGNVPVFYSASVNEKCIDSINNLMKLHNSLADNINDTCFLTHCAGCNKWSLVSLANTYKYAIIKPKSPGITHVDKIFLNTTNNNTSPRSSKYTADNTLIDKSASLAISYDFKDIQRDDATNLNSHIVYNYNTSNKEFILDCKDGYIDSFRDNFYMHYTKKMIGKNDSAYPNIPLTKVKINNHSIDNVFNLYDGANKSFGKNKILNIATLLNNGIEILTLGSTLRKPGYFISVDSNNSTTSNDFNDKIFGEYLIVSTNHIFEGNKYHTNIICTKPYVYNKPENEPKEVIDG